MNNVVLIGRLTKNPEVKSTNNGQMAVCNFTLAIDRPVKQGAEKQADFPRITVFGKQAENCGKYLAKGRQVAIQGRIQTGSYTSQSGATVYTTDIVAEKVQFIDWGNDTQNAAPKPATANNSSATEVAPPTGFFEDDDDIPF